MTLLLDAALLEERRAAARGGLAPLAGALAAELEPLLARGPWFPPEKARLTRVGGRCATDGTLLDFDPWSPRAHRCPRCGATYAREADYRWWIMGWQLWQAERAVHAALLHLLLGDERHARLADAILDGCGEHYARWPNADNVLGPTRPFFSTYLESIWLLQLVVAADLRRAAGAADVAGRLLDRVVEPSRRMIEEYDEGLSNRGTWNAAALLAAAGLAGDRAAAERAVLGPSGVAAHLAHGLLADGSWYEGENYHLFAHRALWYGVTLAGRAGVALPASLLARFEEGFATPFLTALPDFTFPARRDSQWAVSLRQWRFAELCELGRARGDDPRLVAALRTLYDPDVPPADTARARSTAETERNVPAARLTRADLGWKSLLVARPSLPDAAAYVPPPRSVLMEGQGLGVVRREGGRVYVALDYGHSGGGHGHPDRLNLLLHDGATRWLDDAGTGSYVERTLHWYRSTLAHDAPLVDGRSQARVHGRLVAWEERDGAGWIEAEVADAAPGVVLRRTVVVMPDYLVDVVAWRADEPVMVDVPLHADGELHHVESFARGELVGGGGLEDGFDFVHDAEVTYAASDTATVRLDAEQGAARAAAWLVPGVPAEWWRALAPGPPGEGERRFHLTRMQGERGELVTVWSWRGLVTDARVAGDDVIVERGATERHAHRRTAEGWHVDLRAGTARSSLDLAGLRAPAPPAAVEPSPAAAGPDGSADVPPPPVATALPVLGRTLPPLGGLVSDVALPAMRAALRGAHYRRSEQSWREAGEPAADVALALAKDALAIEVLVRAPEPWFAPSRAENPLDNEHPDVNSSGAQLYLSVRGPAGGGGWFGAWLAVPEAAPMVRVTARAAAGDVPPLAGTWARTADGWAMRLTVPRDALPAGALLGVQLVVNEMPAGRERRRGQLVLTGDPGGWVYLRGDRESLDRMLLFRLP